MKASATQGEIKKSYKKLCLLNHPDKACGSLDAFLKIKRAYFVLSNLELKEVYDREGYQALEVIERVYQNADLIWKPNEQPKGGMRKTGGLWFGSADGQVHLEKNAVNKNNPGSAVYFTSSQT